MATNHKLLRPEDYLENACPLCMKPDGDAQIHAIPQQRVIEKMDEYMSRRDYAGAERHLLYWMQEAELGRDLRGQLLVCNELIGHYRKTLERDKAFARIEEALALLDTLQFDESVSAATTFVNAATACSAFGENGRALALFEKARAIYETAPGVQPHLLGGLYNNLALACQALGRFDEAFAAYDKAMAVMARVPGGVLEQAITCLNMADAVAARDGLEPGEERIRELLDRAEALLHDPSAPHDGYYAFVCEKCAPSFAYYGYFVTAEELRETAKRIYERP